MNKLQEYIDMYKEGMNSELFNEETKQTFKEVRNLLIELKQFRELYCDIDTKNKNEVKTAKWKYWGGWGGNHDKRIDDAKCSNCGYKHPVVYRSPENLDKVCPSCGSKMNY